jgi:hypothetical protein
MRDADQLPTLGYERPSRLVEIEEFEGGRLRVTIPATSIPVRSIFAVVVQLILFTVATPVAVLCMLTFALDHHPGVMPLIVALIIAVILAAGFMTGAISELRERTTPVCLEFDGRVLRAAIPDGVRTWRRDCIRGIVVKRWMFSRLGSIRVHSVGDGQRVTTFGVYNADELVAIVHRLKTAVAAAERGPSAQPLNGGWA